MNSQLASEQAFLEAVTLRSKWERDIEEQCEKLQQWRADNKRLNGGKDFGQRLTSLTNFKMKEQGKCFDLARTGRELLITLAQQDYHTIEGTSLEITPLEFAHVPNFLYPKSTSRFPVIHDLFGGIRNFFIILFLISCENQQL